MCCVALTNGNKQELVEERYGPNPRTENKTFSFITNFTKLFRIKDIYNIIFLSPSHFFLFFPSYNEKYVSVPTLELDLLKLTADDEW